MMEFSLLFFCKELAILIILFLISFASGKVAGRLLALTFSFCDRLVVGFLFALAVLEFVCWPMVAFRLSARLFRIVAWGLLAVLTLWRFVNGNGTEQDKQSAAKLLEKYRVERVIVATDKTEVLTLLKQSGWTVGNGTDRYVMMKKQ